MGNADTVKKSLSRLETHYLLSNIKGVLIFILVCYHFLAPALNAQQFNNVPIYGAAGFALVVFLIFVFLSAVPLFVMITGYGSKDTDSCRESAFSLYFVPYILLSVLLTAEYAIFSGVFFLSPFNPLMQLWYLLAMFIWMLILKDIMSIKLIIPVSIVISLVSGMVANSEHFIFTLGTDGFFSLAYVFAFLPYLVIGVKLSQNMLSKIRTSKPVYTVIAVCAALAVLISVGALVAFNDSYSLYSIISLKGNSGYLPYFNNLSSYTAVNISGAGIRAAFMIFVLAAGFLFLRFMPKRKVLFLSRIGNASLTIFCIHFFAVLPISKLFPTDMNIFLMLGISIALSTVICWFLSIDKINRGYMGIVFKITDIIKEKKNKG